MKLAEPRQIKDYCLGIFDGPHATPQESDDGPVFLGIRNITENGQLDLSDTLAIWLGRLPELGLVKSAGRTQGTRYFVDPALLRDSGVKLATSLKRIEPHRLVELVREDLRRYPRSKTGEISARIGTEVNRSLLKRALLQLVRSGVAVMEGQRNGARYRLTDES